MRSRILVAVLAFAMIMSECSGFTAFAAQLGENEIDTIEEVVELEDEMADDEISEDYADETVITADDELDYETIEDDKNDLSLNENYDNASEEFSLDENNDALLGEDAEYISISSADELLALSVSLNSISGGKYILTQDIDMTGKDWIMPKHNPEEFDGDGHTISNLSISFSEPPTRTGRYRCYGMFNNTSVKNLTLNNTTVNCNFVTFDNICAAMTGSGSAVNCILKGCTKFLSPSPETEITYVGGIVGMATDNVDRCILKGEIDCSDITYITSVAGIVGYVLAKKGEGGTGTFVRYCKTEEGSFIKINDSANSDVSGIAGCSETSSPETFAVVNFHVCENNASTNGPVFSGITYGVYGGCAGLSLINCVNKANITLEKMDSCGVGIIHSSNGYIQLISCVNLGNITAQNAYGIIVNLGTSSPLLADRIYVEMTSCANKGNITADFIAAGLAGKSYNAIIRESYNTGDICADSAAGLVENLSSRNDYGVTNETEIRRCYNSGSVRGKYYAAGIVVRIEPDHDGAHIDISDCFNSGIIYYYPDRKAYISGIVANPLYGRLNQEINITRCYNAGAVAPINDELFFSGNQIVGHLIVNSGVDGSTFTETDCFYYNDLNAKAMPRREEYDRLSSCVISEVAKSGEELKNIYTANSDIWRHGKAGYPYPYLKGVGEADLPTDFNHDRDISRLDGLINSNPVDPNAGEEPVITESTVTVKLATKQTITIDELKKEASDGKNYKITYEKSDGKKADSQYAALSNKGVISAKKEGTAKINLVKGDKSIAITVYVVNPKFEYENPKFKKFTVNTGESILPQFENANMKTRFELDKASVSKGLAEIDENTGELTAKKKGTVTVTAIVGETTSASVRKVSTKVIIYDPVIYTKNTTVAIGKKLTLKIKNGVKATEWSISENGIASIDTKGRVSALNYGTTTVFANNNGREMSIDITVLDPEISCKTDTVKVGKTLALKVTNGVKETAWSVEPVTGNAEITEKGVLKGVAAGTVKVKAVNHGFEMSKEIIIIE